MISLLSESFLYDSQFFIPFLWWWRGYIVGMSQVSRGTIRELSGIVGVLIMLRTRVMVH